MLLSSTLDWPRRILSSSSRNMSFLEAELDAINAQEQEKIVENDRQLQLMQKRLREEELKILRGQSKVDESSIDDSLGMENGRGPGGRPMKRLREEELKILRGQSKVDESRILSSS